MALSKIKLSDNTTVLDNVKSVTFKEVVNADDNIRPGCVGSSSIEVEVFNTQANAVSAGSTLYYYQIDQNETETLIGRFTAEPSITTKNSYRFVAYDNAQKLNADFSQWLRANQSNFPQTVKQLVQQACTIAGVTLGSTSWPLSTQNVQAFYADGLTCRDIISYAAEIACKFVRCHTDGKLYFDWYTSNSNSIAPSAGTNQYAYKQDGLTYANFTTTALARVAVHPSGEDDVAYIYPVNVTSGNTLDIKDNLLLTGADASFYNSVAQTVYTAISSLGTYRPMTANLFPRENPFRAGDIVSVTDSQSVTFTAPITGQTVSNSAATLESVGNETYTDYSGSAKGLTQLASDIVRINKLKVGWAEIDNAIVNYLTANDITAQNLTIVDENGTVLATYNASGIVLGQTSEGHAGLDFHSFKLYDKDGNVYFCVEDQRDQSGIATITEKFVASQGAGAIAFQTTIPTSSTSSVKVYVNGVQKTRGPDYTLSNLTDFLQVVFTSPCSEGDIVTVTYETDQAVIYYICGTATATPGMYSLSSGKDIDASGPFSVVCGGRTNSATGKYSAVGGGKENTASEGFSVVSGGRNNEASGSGSSVVGGAYNTASGRNSFVGNGVYNTASGSYSVVLGGAHNTANHSSQLVFGEFNEIDGSSASSESRGNYVEIVGNGTAGNARSNARTLDWSGNQTLAGGLTTGGNVSVTGDISATGAMSADSLSLATALPIVSGGTGAATAAAAKSNLGLGGLSAATQAIPNGSSADIPIASSTSGAIITSGAAAGARDLIWFNCISSGAVTVTQMRNANGLTVTVGTNKVTIANASGGGCYTITLSN